MAAPMDLTKLSGDNLKTLRESAYIVRTFDGIPGIDYQQFFYDYLVPNKPCIFDPCVTEHWKSRKDWVAHDGSPNFDYLRERFGKAVVPVADCKQKEFSSHPKKDLTLEEYLDYWENYRAKGYPSKEPCLYLKDWHFTKAFPSYEAYKTPIYFQSDWLNEFWDTQTCDDYRFVYMGPRGTWTPFHSDVYRSFSWSANICGKKKWIFYPPGCEDYMKDTLGNLVYDVTSPEFKDQHRYLLSDKVKGQQLEVIQGQGQIIFVPSGWHHQVYNLEDTISINHNWLNGCNIDICWRHIQDNLQKVKMEIDDLKDMEGWNDQCQLILNASAGINYETFIQMLKVIAINRLEVLGFKSNDNASGNVGEKESSYPTSLEQDCLNHSNMLSNCGHQGNFNLEEITSHTEDTYELPVQLQVDGKDLQFENHSEHSSDISNDTKASMDMNSGITAPLDKDILTDCVDSLTLKTRDHYTDFDLDKRHRCDSKTSTITDKVTDVKPEGCSKKCINSDSVIGKHATKHSHDDIGLKGDYDQEHSSYNTKLSEQIDCYDPKPNLERENRKTHRNSSDLHVEEENISIHSLTQTDYAMYDLHRIKETLVDVMKDKDYTVLNFEREKSAEYVHDLLLFPIQSSETGRCEDVWPRIWTMFHMCSKEKITPITPYRYKKKRRAKTKSLIMDDGDPISLSFSTTPETLFTMAITGNSSHNSTNASDATSLGRNEVLAKVEISVLAIILYLALFGNIVVIGVLLYRKRKLTRMQLFIIHLSMADIAVALCQVMPQLIMDITYRFDGNNFLCKTVKYTQVLTMYGSTYVLLVTALDRYMSICHPLTSQTWTSRRVHVMAALAWLLSALFSIPQLILFSYKKRYDGVYDCLDNFDFENAPWKPKLYIAWIFVSIYLIPFIMLTACYSKICYIVWISVNSKENPQRSSKKKSKRFGSKTDSQTEKDEACQDSFRNPRAHSKRMSKSKIKTIKLTLAVIICFLVCWAPFFITQMWAAFDDNAPYYTSHVMAIATLLASLNSCTNPWIYLAFSGRLCQRDKRARAKTWTSTGHTIMNDTTELSRGRSLMNGEAIALTANVSRGRDLDRPGA